MGTGMGMEMGVDMGMSVITSRPILMPYCPIPSFDLFCSDLLGLSSD